MSLKNIAFAFILSSPLALCGQNIDLSMQAWYWDYFQGGNYGNWINQLNSKATDLQNAGFKHIWLPPLSRSSTDNNQSNGYNPEDLYDLGEYGPECAWGSRAELNTLITNFNNKGLNVVSDMIYNHRDGGRPEKNEAVRFFVTTVSNSSVYPSDRFFCALPLGSSNPGNNGAGDYYIKVKSKSENYGSSTYKFYAKTKSTAYQGQENETEPNGGADCNPDQGSQVYTLGKDVVCTLWDWAGCWTDEFKITLNAGNFNAADDTLFIYMNNCCGSGYADQYVYGLWSAPRSQDIVNELEYWTYTDFTGLQSGQGEMDYNAFRPNDNTSNAGGVSETLGCDWNCPLFFYDYDQDQTSECSDVLNEWTKWELQQGIKGLRMDAVKHFDHGFVSQLMNYLESEGTIPEYVVGEFFDNNAGLLNGWVNDVYAGMTQAAKDDINVRIFDFALRDKLKNVCDFGHDARDIFDAGVVDDAGGSPFNAVTFIDNHDLRKEGHGIQNDAVLAYAYILTNNQVGAPCVFYPDYYGVQVGNTPLIDLKQEINDLVALHKTYIFGSDDRRYLSNDGSGFSQYFEPNGNNGGPETSCIYQLKPNGQGRDVIVAINFSWNPLDVYQEIETTWGSGPGTTFTDMLGNSSTQHTDITPNREIHVLLPARSYTVYVEGILSPLPVELLDFQVSAEKDDVMLHWQTSVEKDLDRYELERSVSNTNRFETLGSLPAKNAPNGAVYDFTDQKPPYNTTLYYRLKMLDTDGNFKYSPLRQTEISRRKLMASVSPNPGKHGVLLIEMEQAQNLRVRVLNLWGQTIWQEEIFVEKGETRWPLPASNWPTGTYSISLDGLAEQQVLRWVKR
ncbi:MAG: hypothetical protein H7246_21175 [Phycisphaerae bacterium]|nr:hypothetical protein [Saprospiraceae bacterium]